MYLLIWICISKTGTLGVNRAKKPPTIPLCTSSYVSGNVAHKHKMGFFRNAVTKRRDYCFTDADERLFTSPPPRKSVPDGGFIFKSHELAGE